MSQVTGATMTADKIFEIGLAFAASKTLLSAIELGVFTELAKGPADLAELTRRFSLHGRGAADFFDTLVALDLLDRRDGRYHNTPAADQYLDKARPTYIGGLLEMANTRLYPFWANLTEGLKTGEPQNEARTGDNLFDRLYEDPARLKGFLEAMTGLSARTADAIAEKFEWRPYRTFIDVGCAQGGLPVQIARAHRHLSGGGFDLPVVRPIYEEYVRGHDLAGRLKFYEGDMFKQPLPSADVLVMGHILHDWGLDAKRQLCAKAYAALPRGGAFIVYDAMIDNDRRKNVGGLLMSLNMLIETRDGFDYTPADCQGWLREAGFKETRVEPLVGPDTMVVGIK